MEYEYDANGNMTKDLNRNISQIKYNLLNLPSMIKFGSNSYIYNTYSAAGEKLTTQYAIQMLPVLGPLSGNGGTTETEGVPGPGGTRTGPVTPVDTDHRYYCGNVVYDRGVTRLLTDEGYVTFSETGAPIYHYYLRDHLGNIRVVMGQTGTVEQVSHYYAFGGLMRESTNPGLQPYKYGGKEIDRFSGLDAYDFGARSYFADRMQWGSMDPLCEKYYSMSPYGYCHNNPINKFDPDGRDDYYSSNGDYLYRDNNDTDRIMMTRWTIHVEFKDGEKMVAIGGVPIEKKDDISAETYSNIFTDIVSKMPDVDLSKLRKEHISVIVWNGIEDGILTSTNRFNHPDEESGKLASTGNTRITASINLVNDNRKFFSTVSNIQSILGIHEYKGHFYNRHREEPLTHQQIFEMQMGDPTWNKITDELKANIIYNYLKLLRNEK